MRNFFSRPLISIVFFFKFYVKTKKMHNFTIKKVPNVDEIDEILNVLPTNFIEIFIENLLPPR